MKKVKKLFTFIALISMAAAVIMLISAIFGVNVFAGRGLSILITLATTSICSGFAINACNLFPKKRIISLIDFVLLGISFTLIIITYWASSLPPIFGKLTLSFSISSIFFILLVSIGIKLGNKYKILQILTYAVILIVDIIIALLIWGVSVTGLPFFWELFITACLVSFGLLCATSILGKRTPEVIIKEVKVTDENHITITKIEYEGMLAQIKRLQEEISELKNK